MAGGGAGTAGRPRTAHRRSPGRRRNRSRSEGCRLCVRASACGLQVVTSPRCPRQLPDVISNSLFLDAGSPTPAVHRVLTPVSSTVPSAFPNGKWVGFPQLSRLKRLRAGGFSRLQIFRNVPASKFAHPPDRTYRCDTAAGQPGLLRPGISCFVTSARSGYANRPKTGN